jgi:hypothetical protein
MAVIREYERQFGAQGADPGRRASIEDFGSVSHGLADLSHGLGAASSMILQYEENREISDAQIKMSEMDAQFDERRQQLYADAKPGVSTAKQIKDELTNNLSVMEGNYKSNRARQYVKVHGARLTSANVQDAARFDLDLNVKDTFARMDTLFDNANKKVYANPKEYESQKAVIQFDSERKLGVFGFKGDARVDVAINKEVRKRIEGLAYMAAMGDIENPAVRGSIVGQVKPTAATGSLIDQVVKREGGYVSNDAGRGQTNFGINTSAHPGVDIKGLTADKAKEIYKRDYWDAYGIGNLDPSVQAVVFDGVVNHGEPFKTNMVKAAKNGATAEQLGQMRLAEYQRLIAANPDKYAQYEKSWTNRVNETVKTINDSGIVVEAPQLEQKPAWWDDLSAGQQIQITNHALTLQKQNANIADRANAKSINDTENYFAVNGALPDWAPKLSAVTDPEQRVELANLYTAADKLQGIINKPASEQIAFLEANVPKDSSIPGDYTNKVNVYRKMAKFVTDNLKIRDEDPIAAGYKQKFGGSQAPVVPITEYNDVEKLGTALAERMPVAEAIKSNWKTKGNNVLMNHEAENIRNTFKAMPVDQQPAYLAGMAKNISKEQFAAVAQQVWKDDHEIRGAALLAITAQGKVQNGQSAERTSQMILLGKKTMDLTEKQEGVEKMPGLKGIFPSESEIRNYVGAHLVNQQIPESTINAMVKNVQAHYIANAQMNGVQKSYELKGDYKTANVKVLQDSIKTIIGDPSKIGPSTVTRPWGMNDNEFQKTVKNQAEQMGYGGRHYGLMAIDGQNKQYAITINDIVQQGKVIDLRYPAYEPYEYKVSMPNETAEFKKKEAAKKYETEKVAGIGLAYSDVMKK